MAPTRSTRSGAAAAKRSAHWRQRSRPLRNRSGYSSVIGRPDHCLSAISWGTLANRVLLQNLGVEVLVVIADYENLADRNAPETVPREVLAHIADYLAVGSTPIAPPPSPASDRSSGEAAHMRSSRHASQ